MWQDNDSFRDVPGQKYVRCARSQAPAWERTVFEALPLASLVSTKPRQAEPAIHWVKRPSLGTQWWRSARSLEKHAKNSRRGFSLVELMVVMIILAMLAGLTLVAVGGFLNTAKTNVVKTEMATIIKALSAFHLVNGRYPTNDEGLSILKKPTKNFPEGFLSKIPKDPWGTPFVYVSPGSKGPYEIISLGEDKREGGEKMNSDISSNSIEDE